MVDLDAETVMRCAALADGVLARLFARYRLRVLAVSPRAPIPGSHWGAPEAGLLGDRLFVRADTPVHSALHEGCHFVCMDAPRRARLDTDAGGSAIEECAVCFLSVLLAERLDGYDMSSMLDDMDRWGYSFRLGSARAWFETDAEDALEWLRGHHLVDANRLPCDRVRA